MRRYGFAAADVGVRGYNETSNPRLLVLLNGQQVYLDDLGRTQWYTLPVELEEIRQIEIVKGPNTALFGFNAASGVINIITYDPLRESVNTATLRGGNARLYLVVGGGNRTDRRFRRVRLSAGGFRAHEFDAAGIAPEDLPFRASPERESFSLDVRGKAAPDLEVFLSGAMVETHIWEATSCPFYGTDYQRTNWARTGFAADTDYGLIGVSVYRNELRYLFDGVTEREDLHDTVTVVQASDLVKLNADHTVRFGVDYRENTATSSRVVAGTISYQVFSASAMWDWQITPSRVVDQCRALRSFRPAPVWFSAAGCRLSRVGI